MGLISNGTTIFDAGAMMLVAAMTFIKKLTASVLATLSFVDGASRCVLDNTYKEYLFTLIIFIQQIIEILVFQGNDTGGQIMMKLITSTCFKLSCRR